MAVLFRLKRNKSRRKSSESISISWHFKPSSDCTHRVYFTLGFCLNFVVTAVSFFKRLALTLLVMAEADFTTFFATFFAVFGFAFDFETRPDLTLTFTRPLQWGHVRAKDVALPRVLRGGD